jgi:hypothetical protein
VIAADFRGQLERVLAEKEALSTAARAHAAELAAARGAAAQAAARAAAAEAAAGALRAEAARLRVECAGLSAEARRRPGASAGLGAGGSLRGAAVQGWLAGWQAGRQAGRSPLRVSQGAAAAVWLSARRSAQAEALGRHAPPDVLAAAAAAHAAAAADAGAAAAAHEEPRPDAAAFSLAAEHILAAWQAPQPPPQPLQQAGGRRAPAGLGTCAKGRYAGFDDPGEPCEARGAPAGAHAPAPAPRADGLRFGIGECGSGGSGSGGSGPGRSGSGAPGCGSRGPGGGFNRRAPDAAVPALFANRVTGRRSALGVRSPPAPCLHSPYLYTDQVETRLQQCAGHNESARVWNGALCSRRAALP